MRTQPENQAHPHRHSLPGDPQLSQPALLSSRFSVSLVMTCRFLPRSHLHRPRCVAKQHVLVYSHPLGSPPDFWTPMHDYCFSSSSSSCPATMSLTSHRYCLSFGTRHLHLQKWWPLRLSLLCRRSINQLLGEFFGGRRDRRTARCSVRTSRLLLFGGNWRILGWARDRRLWVAVARLRRDAGCGRGREGCADGWLGWF